MSTTLADFTLPQLEELSQKLHHDLTETRMRLKAVNRELAFRQNLAQRAKALEGLTPAEIDRIRSLSQSVKGAGGVPSGEKVDGLTK